MSWEAVRTRQDSSDEKGLLSLINPKDLSLTPGSQVNVERKNLFQKIVLELHMRVWPQKQAFAHTVILFLLKKKK